ncbi:hypothetical protein [Paraburkholderia caledonica]|uniref:Lipoprotein n=1 Tax=Paraburkholderia caledonica TaxID=134536 RepID=A0AB73IPX0_9BURK|nr:hypothetical protein [Paraburkholderia caledonica]
MLRKIAFVLAGVVALALAACAGAPQLTFAQQVSIACGAANGEIAILKGDGVFTGGAEKTLTDTVQPAVDKVCSAGASVSKPDLQSIVNATFPLIKTLVDSSSLPVDKIKAADAAIDTGVLAFNIAISIAPVSTAAAPAAASTPLAGDPLK